MKKWFLILIIGVLGIGLFACHNAEEHHILIAYYSLTGNTEKVVNKIAQLTNGELDRIERVKPYENLQEEAHVEILDGIQPEIKTSVENIEEYDTIFVGYPIWWGEAPAMIATFLAENDFNGKTIIPFCTSAGDKIDSSLSVFEKLCPNATIGKGLTANDENEIAPWLNDLGLL